ncbi:MAG TPA: TRAP transporter substrate-binding protein DctP [Sandaracinaceae bacterium LLY-WYZ-13_1]|nr:TRAP transporter substrate-binding protein DctP [Sandaracinaceae bacterium LLY-WYZ-13_1]
MKRRTLLMALFALGLFALPGTVPRAVDAQDTTTLRLATLAPRGSAWMRVMNAWNNSLRQETNNRLQLRFYSGGSQGDERDVIRKIRIGQLDGAAVTSTGLGLIVRPVLVLQAPGVVETYAQLDRARSALEDEFGQQFEANGVKLMGWGDVGEGRIFSNQPIRRPRDLRSVRPWVWRDDSMFGTFLEVVGANGVRLGVPEVLPALSTGQIDTVVASATAASALQWHTRVDHVTEQANSFLIGATIISKQKYDALPSDLRQALDETSEQAHSALRRRIRRDDRRYYRALVSRHGLTEVDLSAHESEWDQAAEQTRNRLAGRLYPRSLMQRVMRAARGR